MAAVPMTGRAGATEMLARLLAVLGNPDDDRGIAVSKITTVERGVAAEVLMPTGDRYLVIVNWEGDRETGNDDE